MLLNALLLFFYLNEGYSYHQIQPKTGVGKGTVGRIFKKAENDKKNNHAGHSSKLSSTHDKVAIIWKIHSRRVDNAVQAAQFINSILSDPVSTQIIHNTLRQSGFYAAIKKKVPMLKQAHCQKWLQFAEYHRNWTVEDFKWVLWTDETKINRIGSDGKTYVWKERGEPVSDRTTTPMVKHGGGNNLMVWGCMGWNGVGKLVEVVGKMDASQYVEILESGVVDSFEALDMEEDE